MRVLVIVMDKMIIVLHMCKVENITLGTTAFTHTFITADYTHTDQA